MPDERPLVPHHRAAVDGRAPRGKDVRVMQLAGAGAARGRRGGRRLARGEGSARGGRLLVARGRQRRPSCHGRGAVAVRPSVPQPARSPRRAVPRVVAAIEPERAIGSRRTGSVERPGRGGSWARCPPGGAVGPPCALPRRAAHGLPSRRARARGECCVLSPSVGRLRGGRVAGGPVAVFTQRGTAGGRLPSAARDFVGGDCHTLPLFVNLDILLDLVQLGYLAGRTDSYTAFRCLPITWTGRD